MFLVCAIPNPRKTIETRHDHPIGAPFFLFLLLPSWILAAQDAPIDRTVTLTDENGTHEFEITRIFPDRVEVQRGQFKFYFNQSDVKKAENAYASSLIEGSRRLLSRISEQDLDKFPAQLEELEEVQAKVSNALEVFGWLIPELAEMDKRLEENAQGIRSTLRIHRETSRRVEELVEKLRADSPVEATWTEVFDQSSDSVLQIPYDRIRETLVSRIGERRSQIETEIDRNTKYHSQRTQDLMEEVQKEIDGGTMNRQRWSSFLAQLERSIARIPLRRTREEYRAKLDDFISKEQPRVFAGGEAVNPQEPNEEKPPAPLKTRESEEASPSPMAPPGDSEKETGSAEGQPPRIEGRTMTGAKPGPDEDSGSIPGWLLAVVVGTGLGGVMFLLFAKKAKPTETAATKPLEPEKPTAQARPEPTPSIAVEQAPDQPLGDEETGEDEEPSNVPKGVIGRDLGSGATFGKPSASLSRSEPSSVEKSDEEVEETAHSADKEAGKEELEEELEVDLPVGTGWESLEQETPPIEEEASAPAESPAEPETIADPIPSPEEDVSKSAPPILEPTSLSSPEPVHPDRHIEPLDIDEALSHDAALSNRIVNFRSINLGKPILSPIGEGLLKEGIRFGQERAVSIFPMVDRIGLVGEGKEGVRFTVFDFAGPEDSKLVSLPVLHERVQDCFRDPDGETVWLAGPEGATLYRREGLALKNIAGFGVREAAEEGGTQSPWETWSQPPVWCGDSFVVVPNSAGALHGLQIARSGEDRRLKEEWRFPALDSEGKRVTSNIVSVSGKIAGIDERGAAFLLDPAIGEVSLSNRSAKAEGAIGTDGRCVFFIDTGNTPIPSLIRYDFSEGLVLATAALSKSSRYEIHSLEDSLLVVLDDRVILFESDDLSERWDHPFDGKKLIGMHFDASQIALVFGPTSIVVLGRNSGVNLWEVQASEFGFASLVGALVDEDRILAWGESAEGGAFLRMIE